MPSPRTRILASVCLASLPLALPMAHADQTPSPTPTPSISVGVETPTPTPTAVAPQTPTPTPTASASDTPTPDPTPSQPVADSTPAPTPAATMAAETPQPSAPASSAAAATPTPSVTETPKPSATPTPTTPVETEVPTPPKPKPTPPPLGKDIACYNPMTCYLKNPKGLSDNSLRSYFLRVPGASTAPAEDMKPWAYVVLGAGDKVLAASDKPGKGEKVTDKYGIHNHRALFAFCRMAEGGGPVRSFTPRHRIWYQIEAFSDPAPETVWMNGAYLYAYGHNGAIPTC